MKFETTLSKTRGYVLKIYIGEFQFYVSTFLLRYLVAHCVIYTAYVVSSKDALTIPVFFPTVVTRFVYAIWMGLIIFPRYWPMAFLYLASWVVVLLAEVIVDQICALVHWFDRKPEIPRRFPNSQWELVAAIESSNNGYGSDQFCPVIVCDSSAADDPMWPHASSVYMVEIRRRSLIWRTITIWRVSMLDGGKRKVHEFQQFFQWTDANLFRRRLADPWDDVQCYQSGGVVFVSFRCFRQNVLYVYDIRYKKSATYQMPSTPPRFSVYPVAIWCLGRTISSSGRVDGWRIRWLSGSWESGDDVQYPWRMLMINEVIELKTEARMQSQEEIAFGKFAESPSLREVRTGDGAIGVIAIRVGSDDGPVMIYYPANGRYFYGWTWGRLFAFDYPFVAFKFQPPPPDRLRSSTGDCPVFLNEKECIECRTNGNIYRVEYTAPTLKYLAAKTLFRSNPGLRKRMTGDEFRQLTGIDGMEGHFG